MPFRFPFSPFFLFKSSVPIGAISGLILFRFRVLGVFRG
jgi:hypothetical protein